VLDCLISIFFQIRFLIAILAGEFAHEMDKLLLDLEEERAHAFLLRESAAKTKRRAEFIDFAVGNDTGVCFGDALSEKKRGRAVVTRFGCNRHPTNKAGLPAF
jgi:hypothetical protein